MMLDAFDVGALRLGIESNNERIARRVALPMLDGQGHRPALIPSG